MNRITIEFDEKGMKTEISDPIPLETVLQIFLNAILVASDTTLAHAVETDENFDEMGYRASVYDHVNQGITTILERINPYYTRNPGLTEVAILLAENELLRQAEACGMTPEEYLPIAKQQQEKQLKLWRMNQEGALRHNKKQAKLNAIKGGKQ